jgi:hypothetical protein
MVVLSTAAVFAQGPRPQTSSPAATAGVEQRPPCIAAGQSGAAALAASGCVPDVGAGAGVTAGTNLVRQPMIRDVSVLNGLFRQTSVFNGNRYVPGATQLNLGSVARITYVDRFRPAGAVIEFGDDVDRFMRSRKQAAESAAGKGPAQQ